MPAQQIWIKIIFPWGALAVRRPGRYIPMIARATAILRNLDALYSYEFLLRLQRLLLLHKKGHLPLQGKGSSGFFLWTRLSGHWRPTAKEKQCLLLHALPRGLGEVVSKDARSAGQLGSALAQQVPHLDPPASLSGVGGSCRTAFGCSTRQRTSLVRWWGMWFSKLRIFLLIPAVWTRMR